MLKLLRYQKRNGEYVIKVGQKTTLVRTAAEADAFIAGFQIAQMALCAQILPIIEAKAFKDE